MLTKSFSTYRLILLILALFFAASLVGIVAVLYNEAFLYGATFAQKMFIQNPKYIFFIAPPLFFISAYLCRKFAPKAFGNGTHNVLSALKMMSDPVNNTKVTELLSLRIIIITIISSIVCVAGYGALGREGPIVQIGASIFLLIGQRMKRLYPNLDLGAWVIAGSAAGLAAVFNAPLAGIIFITEELSYTYSGRRLGWFQLNAFFAVIVAEFISNKMTKNYSILNFQAIEFDFALGVCVGLLLSSLICAISAWLMQKAMSVFTRWCTSFPKNIWYLLPIFCGILVASIGFIVGSNSFGPGIFMIQEVLQSSHHVLSVEGLLGRFISIIAAVLGGCAGGILLPSLALGANIGSIVGSLLPLLDLRIFVVAGMASFLGALIQAPLTAAILVLEITGQRDLVLPLIASAVFASWTLKKLQIMSQVVRG